MNASEIRKGWVIMYNNAPHRVLEFQHRTPGNLRAFVGSPGTELEFAL